ncbi:biopolymer transporter ExbD [Thalassococcus sp. CAU 1522]|uniref:Biopolymer transporter ExbD n=1 Tax=Thalassococcus arenae TaxID=2851652 RepID=A0ABS6N912_9RHOB|nr:biopolymer transporter ExbD [Thalassococcus arenae]MBV2360501.1 biopolymer transporter ExbD [Thalassococcus arenae]
MLDLPIRTARRRPSLTPMIDVVFLLLIFFMLAARFGPTQALPLPLSSAASGYSGPPRLVTVAPDALLLNGIAVDDLPAALAQLMDDPADTVVLRPTPGTDVERLAQVIAALRAAGLTALAVVE